jgi:metallo-beta-lactamase family protein
VRDRKKIIIPSFVLERAQEIIYILSRYMHEGIIPKIPIFLDSPMAIKITEVYSANWEKGMFSDQKKLPFNPFNKETSSFFNVISTKIDSSALISDPGPYIVVAGSGMCDAGRVRDHLRNGLDNPNVIVCIVGHMADSTLGNKLKRRLPLVLMNGKGIVVNAKIVCFDSFSAHADSSFLVNYAKSVVNKKNKKIFIVHGEEETSITLKLEFMKALKMSDAEVIIPELNQEFEIEL